VLWKYAKVLVAHSSALAEQSSAVAGRATKIVPHLPFVEYAAWAKTVAPDAKSIGKTRVLLLGRMGHDKGLDRLPNIFGHLPENIRERISLSFAGRGNCSDVIAKLLPLVDISRKPADRLLSDIEVIEELANSDILIAPYRLVSASSSVVLPLCRGLRVVAYDTGSLAEVVAPDGLVRPGDEVAFAQRIGAAIETNCGGPLRSLESWKQASLEAWLRAIGGGGRRLDASPGYP
jgi:glycosyltransferase involved in cell wall biosynthesis